MTDIAVVTLPPDSLKIGDEIVISPIPQPTEGSPVILPEDSSDDEPEDPDGDTDVDSTVDTETDETGDQS